MMNKISYNQRNYSPTHMCVGVTWPNDNTIYECVLIGCVFVFSVFVRISAKTMTSLGTMRKQNKK